MKTEEKQELKKSSERLRDEREDLAEARAHLLTLKETRCSYIKEQGEYYEMVELSESNHGYFTKKKENVSRKIYLKKIPLYAMLSLVPISASSLMVEGVSFLAIGSSVCASILIGSTYGLVKQVRGKKHLPTYIQGIRQAEKNIVISKEEIDRLGALEKDVYNEIKEVKSQVQEKETRLNTVEQDVRYDSSIPVFSSDEKPKVFYKKRS